MFDLSVVIVNYNTCDLTIKCLKSLFENRWEYKIEVIVVDNNSDDISVAVIKDKYPQVKLVESPENGGFSKGNNLGISKASGEYVLLLNSDTEVYPGSLDQLLDFAKSKELAVASCKLVFPDGSFQHNGGYLPTLGPLMLWLSGLDDILSAFGIYTKSYHLKTEKEFLKAEKLGWVGGSAMLVKKEIFDKVGLLDEKIFMYIEDVEFCFRVQKNGGLVGWTDRATIMHVGGGSTKTPRFTQWRGEFRGILYLYQKYFGSLASLGLRMMIYFFVMIRVMVFMMLGKFSYSLTYGKVITAI